MFPLLLKKHILSDIRQLICPFWFISFPNLPLLFLLLFVRVEHSFIPTVDLFIRHSFSGFFPGISLGHYILDLFLFFLLRQI